MASLESDQGHSREARTSYRQVWRETWREALTALNIGWDLGLPLVGGTVLGHHLDGRWGKGYTYTLGGMTAGLCVGVYNLVHTLRRATGHIEPRTEQPVPRSYSPDKTNSPVTDAEPSATEGHATDVRLS